MALKAGGSSPLDHPNKHRACGCKVVCLVGLAPLAQWQSNGLLIRRFWVRIPGGALFYLRCSLNAVAWQNFFQQCPSLATDIQHRFSAHPHHVIATLTADGSPRTWGTNVFFSENLRIGAMPGARKIDDLRRDSRCSLHSAPLDEQLVDGDAKLDCLAVELGSSEGRAWLRDIGNPTDEGVVFNLQIVRATLTVVDGEKLRIRSWTPLDGLQDLLR